MLARRCECARPRVFADDPEHCQRCGRAVRDPVPGSGDLVEALVRLAVSPTGKRPMGAQDPK